MQCSFLKRCFHFFLCCFIAAFYTVSSALPMNLYDDVRGASYHNGNGKPLDENNNGPHCDTSDIKYDPLTPNKDLVWDASNPGCAAYMASFGAGMVTSRLIVKRLCRPSNDIGKLKITYEEAMEMEWDSPIITPSTARKMANGLLRCVARQSEALTYASLVAASSFAGAGVPNPYYVTQSGAAIKDVGLCCPSYLAYASSVAAATAALAIIYGVANIAYNESRVCGEGWTKWDEVCKGSEIGTCEDAKKIWVKTKGDYQKCLFETFAKNDPGATGCSGYAIDPSTSISNKFYREFIYGGVEVADDECKNPWDGDIQKTRLGYNDKYQKYYVRGSGNAPSFACHRFLSSDPNDKEAAAAFDCCKKRSQETLCVQTNDGVSRSDAKFIRVGERRNIVNVTFEVYNSRSASNYLCAKTYSVCPYNHLLGGGTEVRKVDPNDSSLTTNTCQHMNHCWKVPIMPYIRTSDMTGAFIAASCKDMKGDSQNFYSYDAGIISVNTKSFSAPMAQCIKETMENTLFNRAGSTICLNPDEKPVNDICTSGDYKYRKGQELKTPSFFSKVQGRLQSFIKVLLILSITAFGVMILFAVPNAAIEKKKLLPYILKIGLVLYFATGNGWKSGFMEGILGTSTMLSEMMFNADEHKTYDPTVGKEITDSSQTAKLDGCQFPRFNYADTNQTTRYDPKFATYPKGSEYLRIWDTLDCKVARALGFGPEVSVPNVLMIAVGGFFTGGLGIVFLVASFLFAFLLIAMTIRALHIFLISVVAIVILFYVSPITIAASLFEKTKGIFQSWLKQLLGFILQPVILFAYLGILITIFDQITIGKDLTFTGNGRGEMKKMVCNGAAADTSLYCIFRVTDIGTNHSLEMLGIGIPFLVNMNSTKLNTIIKGAILMFVFYSFMEKISTFAQKLVGGSSVQSWAPSVGKMASKTFSAVKGVQDRVKGGVVKRALPGVIAAGGKIKDGIRSLGSKGKSIARTSDSSTGNAVGSNQPQNNAAPPANSPGNNPGGY